MNGSKIMCMEVGHLKIRVIDSFSFLSMGLAKLPKTFGVDELKKGYFPHLFNTKANQNSVGPLPDMEFYSPDFMSKEERQKFQAWHLERSGESFDFAKEILEYCRSDVDILRRCCSVFRDDFVEINSVDPFQHVTIASSCMATYRLLHLPLETIAVIPQHGYVPNITTSHIASEWLSYLEQTSSQHIHHSHCQHGETKSWIILWTASVSKPGPFTNCDVCYDQASFYPPVEEQANVDCFQTNISYVHTCAFFHAACAM